MMIDLEKLSLTLMAASITGAGLTLTASNFLRINVENHVIELLEKKNLPSDIVKSFSTNASNKVLNATYLTALLFLISGMLLMPYFINTNLVIMVIFSLMVFLTSNILLFVVIFLYLLALPRWIMSDYKKEEFYVEITRRKKQ